MLKLFDGIRKVILHFQNLFNIKNLNCYLDKNVKKIRYLQNSIISTKVIKNVWNFC